eukprot:c8194_g1_i2.p1 GENE.c8194_g1_i2~~c8194_g1_i2.p1  ORF type:complete len:153 (+),score=16.23 c8194_g1_i2:37-495(+)
MSKGMCSLHRKQRNLNCLKETSPGSGVMMCIPGFECKSSGQQGALICQMHGKKRNMEALIDVWTPLGLVFHCRPEMQCKASTVSRYHPYSTLPTPNLLPIPALSSLPSLPAFTSLPNQLHNTPPHTHTHTHGYCATHQKKRNVEHLQPHPSE